MKTKTSKSFFLCILALACVFFHVHPAAAHGEHADSGEPVTADEVENRDTLRKFVLHAKSHWEALITPDESFEFWDEMLEEGNWKSGSTYLIVTDKQGRAIIHGYYGNSLHGTDLSVLQDSMETSVVNKLIEVAEASEQGGFVDYYWDDPDDPSDSETSPKSAYAANFYANALEIELVLIGGFHHDMPHSTTVEVPTDFEPQVTASDVEDKDTLMKFVREAIAFVVHVVTATGGQVDVPELLDASRSETWKSGEIYLFAITNQGLVIFNGNDPSLQSTSTLNVVDRNGVRIGEEIIQTAADGGGFVSYLWDNPLVDGDEIMEAGKARGTSPKTSYVEQIRLGDNIYIIGSGIYTAEGDDSGGCAIASGARTSNATENTVFSLFLILSVLLPAFFRRKLL